MNSKDITEKKLIDFTDVFADIINVLIFDGENRINGNQLQYALPRSIYKIKGEISEQERDAAKYWRDNTTCFALIGVENQSEAEKHFPLRIISYDGSDYRAQIRHWDDVKRKNAKAKDKAEKQPLPGFYPVVTLVLYFGLDHWNEPLNLKDCFTIPEGIENYVNDYQINLFEIAFLDDDTVAKFQSDFRTVAEYFTQSRKMKERKITEFELSTAGIVHAKEVLELMSALTGDHAFEEAYNEALKGGRIPVRTLIDFEREKSEKIGIEKGEKIGIEKGEEKFANLVNLLISNGRSDDVARAASDKEYRASLYKQYANL